MRKILMLLALLTLVADAALAKTVSLSEARAIAAQHFFGDGRQRVARQGGTDALTLAHESTGYYVFNRDADGGFVIVASDDCAINSVLGYADNGTFDAENMPPQLAWLLAQYDQEIARGAAMGVSSTANDAAADYADIAPLLTTKWDQLDPYNLLCPEYEGKRCVVGCAATAMAQIMNYHEWPKQGTGSHSYDWYVDGKLQEMLSVDFSQSTYDWANMADVYDASSSEESRLAVAKLMYDAGVAVDMIYSPSASNASEYACLGALIDYFGYAKDAKFYYHENFDNATWTKMVYDELAASRPVFYTGQGDGGGHGFVVDGYSQGHFHVNWGWSGIADGYYLLTALEPVELGIGGFSIAFNSWQVAYFGVRPSDGTEGERQVDMAFVDEFVPNLYVITRDQRAEFSIDLCNYTQGTNAFDLGLKLTDENDNITYIAVQSGANLQTGLIDSRFVTNGSRFPQEDGVYQVNLIYRLTGEETWRDVMPMSDMINQVCMMRIAGDSIHFYPTDHRVSVSAVGIASMCAPYPLDFTDIDGLTAYVASSCSADESVVYMTRKDMIAAGEGFMLVSDGGAYEDYVPVVYDEEVTAFEGNLLVGTLSETTIPVSTEGSYNYVFGIDGDGTVGFFKVDGDYTSAANKAYLHTDVDLTPASTAEAKGVRIVFDATTTGIAELEAAANSADGAYYTLTGLRVVHPTKGIYIRNGRKVVVK